MTDRDPIPIVNPRDLTWGQRVYDLRHATGFGKKKFGLICGLDGTTVRIIENGRKKHSKQIRLTTIRKIRWMEERYAEDLAQYRSAPRRWDRLDREVRKRYHLAV